jgi:DNA invertase Pin-like site-specific DNA recombinase
LGYAKTTTASPRRHRAGASISTSTRDLRNTLDTIWKADATFESGVWADTSTPHARLMLTVLGGLAEFWLAQARTDIVHNNVE